MTQKESDYNIDEGRIEELIQALEINDATSDIKSQIISILEWKPGDTLPFDVLNIGKKIDHTKRFQSESTMWYRDYLQAHLSRIYNIHIHCGHFFRFAFSGNYNNAWGLFISHEHDLLEGINPLSDIPAHLKMQLPDHLQDLLNKIDRKLILILSNVLEFTELPKDEAYKCINDTIEKTMLETQVVSYLDKVDGFMSCFHEVTAGNKSFIAPFRRYIEIFKNIRDKLPFVEPLLTADEKTYGYFLDGLLDDDNAEDTILKESLYNMIHIFDIETIIAQGERVQELCEIGTLHSDKTLEDDFGFPAYKAWKDVVQTGYYKIKDSNISGKEYLTIPREVITHEI